MGRGVSKRRLGTASEEGRRGTAKRRRRARGTVNRPVDEVLGIRALDRGWLLNGGDDGRMRDCRNVSARRGEYRVEPQNDAVVVVNRRVVKIGEIARMERVRRRMPVANHLVVAIERVCFMNMLRWRERQDRNGRSKQSRNRAERCHPYEMLCHSPQGRN
jgi:hypothetical protein